jgi:hypothetical protein
LRPAILFAAAILPLLQWSAGSSQESEILGVAIRALPLEGPVRVHPRFLRFSVEGRPLLGQTGSDFRDPPSPAIAELVAENEGVSFCEVTAKGACALRRPGSALALGPVSTSRADERELLVSVVSGAEEGPFRGIIYRIVLERVRGEWLVRSRERVYAYTLGG